MRLRDKVKNFGKNIEQNTVLLVMFFSLGLLLFLSIICLLVPITLTSETVKIIFSSTLSLSGILIAVVGILLTIYYTHDLKGSKSGKKYVILISILTFSVTIGFATSLLALFSLANPGCKILLATLPLLFCSIIYMNTVSIITATITILRY